MANCNVSRDRPALRGYVLPFPLARRYSLVKKLAKQMLARSPVEAERHLASELRRHMNVMRRRQLSVGTIGAELLALEKEGRREFLKLIVLRPRGDQSGGRA